MDYVENVLLRTYGERPRNQTYRNGPKAQDTTVAPKWPQSGHERNERKERKKERNERKKSNMNKDTKNIKKEQKNTSRFLPYQESLRASSHSERETRLGAKC